MILMLIINLLYGVFKSLLSVVPNIPPMPAAITDPLNFVAGFVGSGIGTVQYILTPPIFNALMIVGTGLLMFDILWATFWWIARKIPLFSSHIKQ